MNALPIAGGPPAGVAITGTGIALPEQVLTNDDLSQKVDTSDEWIYQRTKMRERRIAQEGETVVTLGLQAVQNALKAAGRSGVDIDFVICATMSSEGSGCPSAAAQISSAIGARPAGATDITAACSGLVYGMNIAAALIQTGFYRNIAVVGSETMSRIVNWKDRSTCVLFGDGASAAIISATDEPRLDGPGCLYQSMSSDAGGWQHLYLPSDESDIPDNCPVFNGQIGTLQMNGREVYKFAVKTIMSTIKDALKHSGLQLNDLDMIVSHQSNGRILESAREKLGLPEDKLYVNIERYANTSAASVGLCFHELIQEGKLELGSGQKVLFIAMGAGLTWANSLWRI